MITYKTFIYKTFFLEDMKRKKSKSKEDIWKQIKEWQNDPEFLRAAFDFIRYHTGKSQ